MKKVKSIFITILVAILFILTILVGGYIWHNKEMNKQKDLLSLEAEKEQRLQERIDSINKVLEDKNIKIDELNEEKSELSKSLDENIERIKELTIEEEVIFDSGLVMEEIKNISELATVEYRYTNVGTLDSSSNFKFVDVKIPFTKKTVVVTMDGVLKAGFDFSEVEIKTDEKSKKITVYIPNAKFLSNELFEDSFQVYEEKESVWNQITLDDSNSIRKDIKDKAVENAEKNGTLEQANERAKELIKCIIESVPKIKDTYQIDFKTK